MNVQTQIVAGKVAYRKKKCVQLPKYSEFEVQDVHMPVVVIEPHPVFKFEQTAKLILFSSQVWEEFDVCPLTNLAFLKEANVVAKVGDAFDKQIILWQHSWWRTAGRLHGELTYVECLCALKFIEGRARLALSFAPIGIRLEDVEVADPSFRRDYIKVYRILWSQLHIFF